MSVARREDTQRSLWNCGERVIAELVGLLIEAGGDVRSILASSESPSTVEEFLQEGLIHTPQRKLHQIRNLLTVALARLVADRTGREMVRPPDWQMLFFCLASCRTLREAVARGSDFLKVINGRCGGLSMTAGPVEAEIRLDSLWSERNVYTFAVDTLGLATFIDIFAWLIGHRFPISRVLLDYPSEMLADFNPGLFAAPLQLDAGRSGIVLPSRYLDFPVVRDADDCQAGMEAILSSIFDLQGDGERDRWSERTRRIMLRALRESSAIPSLAEVSRRLGCSRDQFRRRLSREGMSYNHLKESCRRELALDLLSRSSMSIEDVAARVGYWDSDAFRQALRKWVGMAPSEFRREASLERR